LNKLNLRIKGGEKIGIVGRTGSGKSTLMLSLLRLLEAKEGEILIDGINIENVPLEELRRRVTVIPQDPQLFEGSLKENVDVLGEFTYEEIQKTLEAVNLGNLTRSKAGLDYQIKSGGENLSAGEKQMICIARALLKKSKVILIDEATSSIDMNNEEVFLNIVRERFSHSTVIMIAHRLKTIIKCDKIAVMREGKVVEFGSPIELLKMENGIFSDMWNETIKAGQN
jgi:ATP-binding cassette subfamily C (CFTR/MRP) protein 1